ncbi:MAG: hypothetical protein JSV07_08475 [Acidimicrobiia bacterium]|jgi:hypothetical protein|nr:MAG: hypothetical protein JSV07_08475 [Acidimicrobiia bacterium]
MSKSTTLVLLLGLLLVACAADPTPTTLAPTDDTPPVTPDPTGPVFVDETDLLVAESFPMQLFLAVQGSLPTPCHVAEWQVEETEQGRFEVTLYSVNTGENCIQVLEPVELNIPLGTSEGGPIEVVLNGETVETADL